jgi:hypothetical protein
MRKMTIAVLVATLSILLLGTAVRCEAGQAQCPDATKMKPILKSNEYYEVLRANAIKVREGVTYEIVQTPEGKSLLRFGFQDDLAGTINTKAATPQPVCGCTYPDVCTINTCAWKQNGDQLLCLGGCYRPDGTACVSCRASLQQVTESQ